MHKLSHVNCDSYHTYMKYKSVIQVHTTRIYNNFFLMYWFYVKWLFKCSVLGLCRTPNTRTILVVFMKMECARIFRIYMNKTTFLCVVQMLENVTRKNTFTFSGNSVCVCICMRLICCPAKFLTLVKKCFSCTHTTIRAKVRLPERG